MKLIFLALVTFLSLFLSANYAYAWGPATHIEFSVKLLQAISLFAPLVKKLLTKHPNDFLYGSVAADITIGKGFRGYLYNCHNWNVALDLYRQKTKNNSQKAFMLGYLAHLAADTVAHNYYIPFKMIRSWRAPLLNHVYWEMRMDLSVPEKYLEIIAKLERKDFAENDKLLEGYLKRTLFSFKTNKRIFNSLLLFQRVKNYRKIARAVVRKSAWKLTRKDIRNYKALATRSAIHFLTHPNKTFSFQTDPTGKLKILYARDIVKKLKQAKKRGILTEKIEHRFLLEVKKQLRKGLYEAVTLPNLESYLDR